MKSPRRASRSSERGYSEALVPLMTLIVYGLLAATAVAFISSFVLPARFLKGRLRIAALGVAAIAWGALYWHNIGEPEQEKKWRLATWDACKAKLASVPSTVETEGFLDEGAALRKHMLLQLFSDRRLSFVEIQAGQDEGKPPHIAYPDGDQEQGWHVPDPRTRLVRLELGNELDSACAKLPYGLEEAIRRPPFLPDTCIKLTYLDAPTARYGLSLQPAVRHVPRKHGSWRLVDRRSGDVLASLPTVDPSPWISSDRALSRNSDRPLEDCRSPHTILVDRMRAHPTSSPALGSQVLAMKRVQAERDILEIDAGSAALPVVAANAAPARWTEEESRAVFHPEIHKDGWRDTVAGARQQGSASYGPALLDWPERTLVSFVPTKQENSYPWRVFAVGSGFFVASTSPSWYERSSSVLARFRVDGTFAWAVRVLTPSTRAGACTKFWPQAMYVTASHLVIADSCLKLSYEQQRETGKSVEGEVWSVPLSAMPTLD